MKIKSESCRGGTRTGSSEQATFSRLHRARHGGAPRAAPEVSYQMKSTPFERCSQVEPSLAAPEVRILNQRGYRDFLRARLTGAAANGFSCIDGWAGAGGLSLGFEAAGFAVSGYERNPDAIATYHANLKGPCTKCDITPETEWPAAEVFIGGPPCQPFSFIGGQAGKADPRDGFPAFVAAVKAVSPDVFLCENVPGLLGRNRPYFDHITRRLRRLGYSVQHKVIDASYHGVPQRRRRLVIVGSRRRFDWPTAEHVRTTAGVALGARARAARTGNLYLTRAQDEYISRYEAKSCCVTPRDLHLEAPARTVTCRNIGGATSDMHRLVMADGRRRRLTVEEAAILQSFPSSYSFKGSLGSRYDQVGNAVPPLVARHLADVVLAALRA